MTITQPSAKRGPYAKTVQKRAEILDVALKAYASSGRQGPSLKSIADAVGMTEAGILHHFPSKDHLLVEILEARDAQAKERGSDPEGPQDRERMIQAIDETTRTPGLVKLFVDMSAASADPDHPAAAFMRRHSEAVTRILTAALGEGSDWQARILLSAAEGLQIQWLRDETIDIVADLSRLFLLIEGAP